MSNENPHYYRERDLIRGIVPFSAATLWRRVRQGLFPAPIKFGVITAWRASDVHQWLDAHHHLSHDTLLDAANAAARGVDGLLVPPTPPDGANISLGMGA